MGLEMKTDCLGCDATFAKDGEAYICTHECTWCRVCAEQRAYVCDNCQGELVRRPRPPVKS